MLDNHLLDNQNTKLCIVGLGYVGLPLALAFAEHFDVLGFDNDASRISALQSANDHTSSVNANILNDLLEKGTLHLSSLESDIASANIFIVTVPTPVDECNKPNLKPLKAATRFIARSLKKGDLVIYESTVYPGVTEDICVPILRQLSQLTYNKDFHVGYSPERISPGDEINRFETIVKVTSGSNEYSAKLVDALYSKIVTAGTFMATSIKEAEASKMVENVQRDVNIALMNEFSQIFDRMNISTTKVIQAASTKWNFHSVNPGLVGGHCISVDPYYLMHKAQSLGFVPDIIRRAREINNSMPHYLAQKVINKLALEKQVIPELQILIAGFAYKANCADTRNTRVADFYRSLVNYCSNIDIFDPYVRQRNAYESFAINVDNHLTTKRYDLVIKCVDHQQFSEIPWEDYLVNEGTVIELFD